MTDGTLRDITVVNPSDSWGEGEMISTSADLDRLVSALFSGALLPPHLLRKMFALPPEDVLMLDGTPARYSTGLQTVTLNGITFWGKTGEQYGYANGMFSTRDQQRRIIFAFNPTHRDATQQQMTLRIAQAATNAP
jgi:D-alanyl-D-alanine carboxypeptidase